MKQPQIRGWNGQRVRMQVDPDPLRTQTVRTRMERRTDYRIPEARIHRDALTLQSMCLYPARRILIIAVHVDDNMI